MAVRWRVCLRRRSEEGGEITQEKSYQTDQTDFGTKFAPLPGCRLTIPPRHPAPDASPPYASTPYAPAPDIPATAPPKPRLGFEALSSRFRRAGRDDRPAAGISQYHRNPASRDERLGFPGTPRDGSRMAARGHLRRRFLCGKLPARGQPVHRSLLYGISSEPDTMEALVYDAADMAVRLVIANPGVTREAFRKGLMRVAGIRA